MIVQEIKGETEEEKILESLYRVVAMARSQQLHQFFIVIQPNASQAPMEVFTGGVCDDVGHQAQFLGVAISQAISAARAMGIDLKVSMHEIEQSAPVTH